MSVLYSAAQVVFLRDLEHLDAVKLSTRWFDSCARLTHDGHHSPGASDEEAVDLPLIACWRDVKDAYKQLEREDRAAVQLLDRRIDGATERELAEEGGVSQATVHRQVRNALDQVLRILNGEPRVVHPSMS